MRLQRGDASGDVLNWKHRQMPLKVGREKSHVCLQQCCVQPAAGSQDD